MAEDPQKRTARIMRKKLIIKKQVIINHQHDERRNISGTERNQDGFDVPFGDTSELSVRSINNDKQKIIQIEQALRKIDEGTYGICHKCKNPIALERLKLIPDATLCIACKTAEENKGPHRR